MNEVFTIENMRPIRDGMTVSRDSMLGTVNKVTFFSMGSDTSISQESYDRMTMYIGASESVMKDSRWHFYLCLNNHN